MAAMIPGRISQQTAERLAANGEPAYIVHRGRTAGPVMFGSYAFADTFAASIGATVNDYETGEIADE